MPADLSAFEGEADIRGLAAAKSVEIDLPRTLERSRAAY